jgi:hypothetical protein
MIGQVNPFASSHGLAKSKAKRRKARVSDTFVKDSLGNSALIRAETKTVLIVSDFNKHVRRKVEVYYITSKVNPKLKEPLPIAVLPRSTGIQPALIVFGRLSELAGKWNGGENK